MRYKEDRQRIEFLDSDKCDWRVHSVLIELDRAFLKRFGRDIMVTHIKRLPEEQASFYPENPTKPSGHLETPSRCADIRCKDMTGEQMEFIRDFCRQFFPQCTVILNDRGATFPHLHLQFPKFVEVTSG